MYRVMWILQHRNNAVIFPDADAPIQMWNYKNYVKVVQNLISEYGVQCLILGGNRYRDTGAAIEKEVNSSLCKNRMGETNLVQCIQLVRNASIVISNDTGGAILQLQPDALRCSCRWMEPG